MTSHVAGVWGALRHRVPETLSRPEPEPPAPGPPREPATDVTRRPWPAITLLAVYSAISVGSVTGTWTDEQASAVLRGDQRALFIVTLAVGIAVAAGAVAGVVAGLMRRRALTGALAAVAGILAGVMVLLGWLLPEGAVHAPSVLLAFLAVGSTTTNLPAPRPEPGPTHRRASRPGRGHAGRAW